MRKILKVHDHRCGKKNLTACSNYSKFKNSLTFLLNSQFFNVRGAGSERCCYFSPYTPSPKPQTKSPPSPSPARRVLRAAAEVLATWERDRAAARFVGRWSGSGSWRHAALSDRMSVVGGGRYGGEEKLKHIQPFGSDSTTLDRVSASSINSCSDECLIRLQLEHHLRRLLTSISIGAMVVRAMAIPGSGWHVSPSICCRGEDPAAPVLQPGRGGRVAAEAGGS
jgi:hypothetical protein